MDISYKQSYLWQIYITSGPRKWISYRIIGLYFDTYRSYIQSIMRSVIPTKGDITMVLKSDITCYS